MNILFYFENVINPTLGGTERATENLAKALSEDGHSIFYCAKREDKYDTPFPSVCLPESNDLVCGVNKKFIEKFVRQNKIDVIFNQGGNTSDVRLFNHRVLNVDCKIVTSLHFCPYQGFGKYYYSDARFSSLLCTLKTLKMPINRRRNLKLFASNYEVALKYSDAFVVLSDSFVDDVCEIIKSDAYKSKIHVIPNINSFTPHPDATTKRQEVLYVGRLAYTPKRIDRLLDAWVFAEQSCSQAHLNILGDGPERSYYELYSKRKNLKNVSFCGFQNPVEYYSRAKVIALTSTHESFGMTLIEGMSYNAVPVAFGSYSSAKDIVKDGFNGRLVKPFDTESFANAIIDILQDDRLYNHFCAAGMETIQKYTQESIIPRWENLLNSL